MKIHYLSPFSVDKNIGKAINEAVIDTIFMPDDWFVLTDHDVLWLLPDSKAQVERILAGTTYDVLGCMTNRIRSPEQLVGGRFNEDDRIRGHINIAEMCRDNAGDTVKQSAYGVVAAFCMCFRVSVWESIGGFTENSIIFDTEFCRAAAGLGLRIGIMTGVYVFHVYRLNQKNPKSYVQHLLK